MTADLGLAMDHPTSAQSESQSPEWEDFMSNPVYTADIRIERIKGPYRHAWLPAHDGPVEFGVHGAISEHYGVEPDREVTTTLDYVMAATGG